MMEETHPPEWYYGHDVGYLEGVGAEMERCLKICDRVINKVASDKSAFDAVVEVSRQIRDNLDLFRKEVVGQL